MANIFAAYLLLYDGEIRKLANYKLTGIEIAGLLNVNINLLMFKMNEINRFGANNNLRSPSMD